MTSNDQVVIFSTVWPEPQSSAAGVRQMQWIEYFVDRGCKVALISPSKLKTESEWGAFQAPDGVTLHPVVLNDSRVETLLKELNPKWVMFDRFLLEEQFGHFVQDHCPNAITLLETQDLHLIRKAREKKIPLDQVSGQDFALREISSILRVDSAFVVSSFEERFLHELLPFRKKHIHWVPFSYAEPMLPSFEQSFENRDGFVWVGNFRHPPNVDGLSWFVKNIWPKVYSVTQQTLRIYGAYPSAEVMKWNQSVPGIIVHGQVDTLEKVFETARVNLAPLLFGAGVKGKVLEGWRRGVPVVGTPVAAEGLMPQTSASFFGVVESDPQAFAEACIRLVMLESVWNQSRQGLFVFMQTVYSHSQVRAQVDQVLGQLELEYREGRLPDLTARVLRFEGNQHRRYFSRWIEVKEKLQESLKGSL